MTVNLKSNLYVGPVNIFLIFDIVNTAQFGYNTVNFLQNASN